MSNFYPLRVQFYLTTSDQVLEGEEGGQLSMSSGGQFYVSLDKQRIDDVIGKFLARLPTFIASHLAKVA